MRVFLLCMFVFAFAHDNSSEGLTKALSSDNLSLGVIDQQGVFFKKYPNAKEDNGSFMSFKTGAFHFTGVSLLESNHNPTLIDVKDPAFMFNIKLSGDNVEIGGGIRDLSIGDWTDIMSETISKKKRESR